MLGRGCWQLVVMAMNGEEGLECKIYVDGMRLERMSEFKYLRWFWMNQVHIRECRRKVASGWRVACAIRYLVIARGLQLEYANVLHESLLITVLIYGSD